MNSEVICNTKAAAIAVLETIAGIVRGTQRDALLAVISWIGDHFPRDFDAETQAKIQRIYDENFDEAGRKSVTWQVEGGEPEDGCRAMVPFIFNANTKTWELENEMPPVWTEPNPHILPKTDGYESEE